MADLDAALEGSVRQSMDAERRRGLARWAQIKLFTTKGTKDTKNRLFGTIEPFDLPQKSSFVCFVPFVVKSF